MQHIRKIFDREKFENEKAPFSHNFIAEFNWFWGNVKHNLCFLGKPYRVCKDI